MSSRLLHGVACCDGVRFKCCVAALYDSRAESAFLKNAWYASPARSMTAVHVPYISVTRGGPERACSSMSSLVRRWEEHCFEQRVALSRIDGSQACRILLKRGQHARQAALNASMATRCE